MFRKNQLVWVKIDKFPLWPAKIIKAAPYTIKNKICYDVKFLGDSSTATIIEEQVSQFDIERPEYTPDEKCLKKHRYLRQALQEAAEIHNFENNNKNQESLNIKGNYNKQSEVDGKECQHLSVIKKSRKSKLQKSPELTSILKNERQIYSQKSQTNNLQTIEEIQKIHQQQLKTNQLNVDVQDLVDSGQNKQISEWKPSLSIEVLEDLSNQILKKMANPLISEIKSVPIKSFKDPYFQGDHFPICSINKKQKILQKNKQKDQLALQSFEKAISKEGECFWETYNSPETRLCRQIKFKLQCLVFQISDGSTNNGILKNKIRQIKELIEIAKISAKALIDSKINALLSFLLESLSVQFSEQKSWITQVVNSINQKIIKHLNEFKFYSDFKEIAKNFVCQRTPPLITNNQLVSKQKLSLAYSPLSQFYKPKIIKLLGSLISQSEEQQVFFIVDEILNFLQQNQSRAAQKWKYLENKANNMIYSNKNDCWQELCELMSSFS